jgi:hypothetical protein
VRREKKKGDDENKRRRRNGKKIESRRGKEKNEIKKIENRVCWAEIGPTPVLGRNWPKFVGPTSNQFV